MFIYFQLTKALVSKHTSGIKNTYYTAPLITYSVPSNLIDYSDPVTVKTEITQDQAVDETDQILNNKTEQVKENEQEMQDEVLVIKNKPIVCEKWKELATCEKKQVIFQNEHVILIRRPVSKHAKEQNASDIKQILQVIKYNKESTPPSEKELKIDQFNTKLTQALEDELNALDDEPLREDEEPKKDSFEECIQILSDEDEEMPVRNDQSIPIEDMITDKKKDGKPYLIIIIINIHKYSQKTRLYKNMQ